MCIPLKYAPLLALYALIHAAVPLSAARADDLGPSTIDIAVGDCQRVGGTVEGSKCRLPSTQSNKGCGWGCLIIFSAASYALAAYLADTPSTRTSVRR
jgi:hypothetical protein